MNTTPFLPLGSEKLYSARSINLATFLGGPLAGTYMLSENFKSLGRSRESRITLYSGIGFTLLFFSVLFMIPEQILDRVPNQVYPAIYTMILWALMEHYQGAILKAYKEEGREFHSAWRAAGIGVISLAIILSFIFSLVFLDPSQEVYEQYDTEMAVFFQNEEETMSFYDQVNTKSSKTLIYRLDNQILPKWEENLRVLEKVNTLEDLPSELVRQNAILKKYAELRLQAFQTFRKAIEEDTHLYNMQLEAIHQKIEEKMVALRSL